MNYKLKVATGAFNNFADIREVLQPSPSTKMSLHIVALPSLSFCFTLLANLGTKHYNETAGGAAVLGMINLCKLCKLFAFLSMMDDCIPKLLILTCWKQIGKVD